MLLSFILFSYLANIVHGSPIVLKPKNQQIQIETTTPSGVTQAYFSNSVSETLIGRPRPAPYYENKFDAPVIGNRVNLPNNNANITPNTGFVQGEILPARPQLIERPPFQEYDNFHKPIRHVHINRPGPHFTPQFIGPNHGQEYNIPGPFIQENRWPLLPTFF